MTPRRAERVPGPLLRAPVRRRGAPRRRGHRRGRRRHDLHLERGPDGPRLLPPRLPARRSRSAARSRSSTGASAPLALPTRIGLNAGWVMVGNVGGSGHFAYSVVGDCVNTAARLESLNKQLGTRILASEAVTGGSARSRDPAARPLRAGRPQPAAARWPRCSAAAGDPQDAALLAGFAEALALLSGGTLAGGGRALRGGPGRASGRRPEPVLSRALPASSEPAARCRRIPP